MTSETSNDPLQELIERAKYIVTTMGSNVGAGDSIYLDTVDKVGIFNGWHLLIYLSEVTKELRVVLHDSGSYEVVYFTGLHSIDEPLGPLVEPTIEIMRKIMLLDDLADI